MPGGGTPALVPMSIPALVCGFPPASMANADDDETAITPAAANRALDTFIFPSCLALCRVCEIFPPTRPDDAHFLFPLSRYLSSTCCNPDTVLAGRPSEFGIISEHVQYAGGRNSPACRDVTDSLGYRNPGFAEGTTRTSTPSAFPAMLAAPSISRV